jgi:hypothetical protein
MHIGHVARRCSMNKQHEKEQGHAYAFLKALAPCCMDLDSKNSVQEQMYIMLF